MTLFDCKEERVLGSFTYKRYVTLSVLAHIHSIPFPGVVVRFFFLWRPEMGLRVEHVTVTILTKRGRPAERYFRRQGLKKNQRTVCAYIQTPPWRREKEHRALVAECQSTAADERKYFDKSFGCRVPEHSSRLRQSASAPNPSEGSG